MSKYTSKKSFLESLNVDRRFLTQYVSRKLNRSIKIHHVAAVIGFLFDELISELYYNKMIVIGKFGKFFIKKLGPRRHYNVIKKEIMISEGHEILRFKLHKDIKKILTNNLDIAKTFGERNNG